MESAVWSLAKAAKAVADAFSSHNSDREWLDSTLSSPQGSFEFPGIATNETGMVTENEGKAQVIAAKQRKKRQTHKYVSKHFRSKPPSLLETPPITPTRQQRVAGVDIDDLSSDSPLTDVPDCIGPDPFTPSQSKKLSGVKAFTVEIVKAKAKHPTKSPYFAHKPRPQFLSCLPFPPLSHPTFGLMQERLAHDPFRLLIATIFLNRTRGEQAMPTFYRLMERYPTVADLAAAEIEDVTGIIQRLGFQNQRARKCVQMAKMWIERPPERGKRMRKKDYPKRADGKDVRVNEVIDEEDDRVAWEISHLPGLGPYSHDSWRMFCRDELRGVASDWLGNGAEYGFEPEWKRVLPTDKELRAWATWMWLKEGWSWNKETGERTEADPELLEMARGGGIIKEEERHQHLVVTAGHGFQMTAEKPAGDFM